MLLYVLSNLKIKDKVRPKPVYSDKKEIRKGWQHTISLFFLLECNELKLKNEIYALWFDRTGTHFNCSSLLVCTFAFNVLHSFSLWFSFFSKIIIHTWKTYFDLTTFLLKEITSLTEVIIQTFLWIIYVRNPQNTDDI